MRAIILAGGMGSRLEPITKNKPKTLVLVNNKPILGHILDSLLINNVRKITVVTGYLGNQIKDYCLASFPRIDFEFVEDKDYLVGANNLHGLYLARKYFNEDSFILNADLVFDQKIIKKMIRQKGSCIAVDVGTFIEEAMKVTTQGKIITGISKAIEEKNAHGSSIDIYKFTKQDLRILKKELENAIEKRKEITLWMETAFDKLFGNKAVKMVVCPIGKMPWAEIDNFEDLGNAEIKFNSYIKTLKQKEIFFVDNDGTITLGGNVIDGALDFIKKINDTGKTLYLLTNNSSRTPEDISIQFKQKGLPIEPEQILISTHAAVAYLIENKKTRVFWIANKKVDSMLRKSGLDYDESNPEALLLTYDTEITYEKIKKIVHFVSKGIPYYATHIDIVCPTSDGFLPDIGTFIKMIESTTGSLPFKTFGKPEKDFIKPVLKKHGISPKNSVIIGDRLYTDIALGTNVGASSILVLSGETSRHDYEQPNLRASAVVNNLGDLTKFL